MSAEPIDDLPICECLPDILAAAEESIPIVLKAPPGAGKTTGIPPALFSANVAGDGRVLLIQPRRLAARSAAAQIAKRMHVNVGETVGYQVRLDNRTTSRTKLICMTTGILLRRLQNDPLLEDVSCVLLDEFHERSLEMDLALGMLHRIRTSLRPELKLIVMSATLDPATIVAFLGQAKAITSEGRSFPVQIRYSPSFNQATIEQQVTSVLPEALRIGSGTSTPGHVLVFLPGVGEIHRVRQAIESMRLESQIALMELYGDMPPEKQDLAIAPSQFRKIVLATNVAETSITIPGVTVVIDSGSARVLRYDSQVGLPKLQREPISQASADQRAGRAGRTAPGVCFRLWHEAQHRSRRERDTPEIERGDFSEALLTLSAWGERDVYEFPWLSPPPQTAVDQAKLLLKRLGAIDDATNLTALGRAMLSLPIHPRLARFMVAAKRLDVLEDASIAAALLTERDPFRGQPSGTPQASTSQSDVLDRILRLKALRDGKRDAEINESAARNVLRVASQLFQQTQSLSAKPIDTEPIDTGPVVSDIDVNDRLKLALLAAYPDRVARRRAVGAERGTVEGNRGIMVGGRGVRLAPSSSVRQDEYFLCIDVDSAGTEASVRCASAIDVDWLDPRMVRELDEPFFNPSLKAVVARRRRYYEDLMLSESPVTCKPSEQVAEILLKHVRQTYANSLPTKDESVADFVGRVRFLTEHCPELGLPVLDDASIEELMRLLCQRCTSVAELQSAPWLDHLRGRFDYAQQQLLDKHAPARLTLPSGNTAAVQYVDGRPPSLEVRIQELFGWHETPRIAGGKVALQLHLLGPNHRPQQITEDLANFWRVTYVQIRKELKRRYPKHYWPDDPLTATATRNCLKPRDSTSSD